jgi:hypothetical protein
MLAASVNIATATLELEQAEKELENVRRLAAASNVPRLHAA